ncbi:hypothetical protein B0H34DRAFT_103880 [Crassisporium funariophilum]|nr:hypothetical protein B0H34DRAFT_103880 [Crassisporium funariophilum]
MLNGPTDKPFFWSDLLAFVEFKMTAKKAAKSSASESKQSDALSASELTSSGVAPAVVSTSSAIASTSSSTSLTVNQPPRFSTSGNSGSSQKRPREDVPETPKKRRKGDKSPPKAVRVQCASYALEMLSHGGLRTHVISALVTDTELVLLFYDRSLPVESKHVDFFKEPASLVAFIYCLHHATPSQWGRVSNITLGLDPLSTPDTHKVLAVSSPPLLSASQAEPDETQKLKPHPLRGAILTLNNGTKLLLTELVFVQHALIGRGTCVVRAKVFGNSLEDWKDKSIVVKFSFTPKTRVPEGNILAEILSIANGHSKMKAGDTTANGDIMDDTDTMKDHEKPNHAWVIDHLPDVLHYEALELTDDDVQSRLSKHLESKEIYEDRVLQILVMTELFSITKLKTSDELVPVIKDIFKCYRWLYEHAELIHRDISLNNLMYREVDGRICGVLSDYDLSLFFRKPKPGPSSKQRTGTRPYMAIELLLPTPTKHLYRHDLESLYYVIFVLVTRYDGGEPIKNPPLQDWFELPPESLRQVKLAFFQQVPPPFTSAFKSMRPLLMKMFMMFHDGYDAQLRCLLSPSMENDPKTTSVDHSQAILDPFLLETLGGNVDFDAFQRLLQQ